MATAAIRSDTRRKSTSRWSERPSSRASIAMASSSRCPERAAEHNRIAGNLYAQDQRSTSRSAALRGVYIGDMRVRVSRDRALYLPRCRGRLRGAEFEDDEARHAAQSDDDRGGPVPTDGSVRPRRSSSSTTDLPSLREYVLVAQDKVLVERFVRQGEEWVLSEYRSLDDTLVLESIGCASRCGRFTRRSSWPRERLREFVHLGEQLGQLIPVELPPPDRTSVERLADLRLAGSLDGPRCPVNSRQAGSQSSPRMPRSRHGALEVGHGVLVGDIMDGEGRRQHCFPVIHQAAVALKTRGDVVEVAGPADFREVRGPAGDATSRRSRRQWITTALGNMSAIRPR